jgi:hypothetical protein
MRQIIPSLVWIFRQTYCKCAVMIVVSMQHGASYGKRFQDCIFLTNAAEFAIGAVILVQIGNFLR